MTLFLTTTPGALFAIAGATAGIWFGSELVVKKAKILARCLGLSELIIGLTIVSIGTSLPEIFVNIASGLKEAPSVGVGNIIGSCFAQMTVVLGLCILIGGPASITKESIRRDGSVLLGCILLLILLGRDGNYTTIEGVFLALLYIVYVTYLVKQGAHQALLYKENGDDHCPSVRIDRFKTLGVLAIGIILIYLSAAAIVSKGIMLGERFGLSEVFIGVLSGLGTSIPELVVSLTALLRRSSSLSIGNLIGSNITDPLFSLGIGSAIGNYTFDFADFVAPFSFWLAGSALAMVFLWTKLRIERWEAATLMGVYGGYLWWVLG